jgi:hypothetical protein
MKAAAEPLRRRASSHQKTWMSCVISPFRSQLALGSAQRKRGNPSSRLGIDAPATALRGTVACSGLVCRGPLYAIDDQRIAGPFPQDQLKPNLA